MEWWHWMLLGLFFLVAEMATPGGFFALFFGLSGILVGALAGLGWARALWLQWLLFSVISVGTLVALRGPLRGRVSPGRNPRPVDSLVGEAAVALEDLPSGGVGKVEVRGSSWSARNAGSGPLSRGQRCRVERVEGLMLWVRPE